MRISIFVLLLFPIGLLAQNPIASFTISNTACLNEQLLFNNQSTNATNYEWDFCQGDLGLIPNVSNFSNLATFGGNVAVGIDFVFDQGKWFGFYCSLLNNSIFRLDFGNDLANSNPTVTNLGNIGNIFNGPQAIKIVKDGNSFFGFVSNRNGFKLIRIEFGTTVTSPASSFSATGIISGNAIGNGGLDVVNDGGKWVVAITNQYNVSLVYFNNSLSNIPQGSDVLETDNFFGASTIGDISIVKFNNKWFGFSVSIDNGRVYKLIFGNSLFSQPIIDRLNLSLLSSYTPVGIWAVKENAEYRLFVGTNQGNLFRIDLGSNLETPTVVENDLGNFGMLSSNLKIRGVRDKSRYYLFTSNWQSNDLYRLIFPQNCLGNEDYSSEINPKNIRFNNEGTLTISLHATKNRLVDEQSQNLTVSSNVAPEIAIESAFNCLTTPIDFSFITSDAIDNVEWSFGDNIFSNDFNPNHTYSSSGVFNAQLTVQSSTNGCSNYTEKTIKIYEPPIASFTSPSGLICTNNQFTFTNTTADNFDGNLTYQWLVDGQPASTARNLQFSFASGGAKNIVLQASIPGCTSQASQNIADVGVGPIVDFSIANKCLNQSILYTNNSSGAIAAYVWNFGDGQSSAVANPTHSYATAASYSVQLAATGVNGCVSTKAVNHQIFTAPQPNFFIDLPPFSCSGTSTQFNDLTPPLTDSNVTDWLWTFDDGAATSASTNPQHTYATSNNYNVSLQVTSNQNCTAQIVKSVFISPSPIPIIANSPPCLADAVNFSDGSGVSAIEWIWQAEDNFYFTDAPSHVFSGSGSYLTNLTMTATNGCIGTASKVIAVPNAPGLDFIGSKKCVDNEATFLAVITPSNDAIVDYVWQFGADQTTGSNTQYTFSSVGSKEVVLTATTASGCDYSITKAVTVVPSPIANFSFTPESGKPPLAVQFTNLSLNASNYEWTFNDSENSTSILASPLFTYTQLGSYAVDLRAANAEGCESILTKLVKVVVPQVQIYLSDLRVEEIGDGSLQTFVTLNNTGNTSLQNVSVDVTLSNGTQFREVVPSINDEQVLLYEFNTLLLQSPSIQFICVSVSVPENSAAENLNLCQSLELATVLTSPYPNPADDELVIEWVSLTEEQVKVTIINQLGEEVYVRSIASVPGLNTQPIAVSDVAPGVYFVRISSTTIEKTFRTIISR